MKGRGTAVRRVESVQDCTAAALRRREEEEEKRAAAAEEEAEAEPPSKGLQLLLPPSMALATACFICCRCVRMNRDMSSLLRRCLLRRNEALLLSPFAGCLIASVASIGAPRSLARLHSLAPTLRDTHISVARSSALSPHCCIYLDSKRSDVDATQRYKQERHSRC